jgi:hypothetical protein
VLKARGHGCLLDFVRVAIDHAGDEANFSRVRFLPTFLHRGAMPSEEAWVDIEAIR